MSTNIPTHVGSDDLSVVEAAIDIGNAIRKAEYDDPDNQTYVQSFTLAVGGDVKAHLRYDGALDGYVDQEPIATVREWAGTGVIPRSRMRADVADVAEALRRQAKHLLTGDSIADTMQIMFNLSGLIDRRARAQALLDEAECMVPVEGQEKWNLAEMMDAVDAQVETLRRQQVSARIEFEAPIASFT